MLDHVARAAAGAAGPPPVVSALGLLGERLAAVCRLRAAQVQAGSLRRRVASFREAVGGSSLAGTAAVAPETSACLSAASVGTAASVASGGGLPPTPTVTAAAVSADGGQLVLPLPAVAVEGELAAGLHLEEVLGALGALAASGSRLRAYRSAAAVAGDAHGLRAAAALLLLGADAGMGPAEGLLALAREAMAAVLAMAS